MWFLWQLLHQRTCSLLPMRAAISALPRWGDNTLTLIQSTSLQAFWAMGETRKSRSKMFCMLGRQAAVESKHWGRWECLLSSTLFGGSFSAFAALNLFFWGFLLFHKPLVSSWDQLKRQNPPIKVLIIPLGPLSRSWKLSWPSKNRIGV